MRRRPSGVVLLVAAGLIFGSLPRPAFAEWTRLITTDASDWYADETLTRKRGTMAKVWSLQDYQATQPLYDGQYQSMKMQAEIRCHSGEWRVLYFSYYSGRMGTGKQLYVQETAGPWKRVDPGGYTRALFDTGCHPVPH